jgi:transcriptional antiterminator RfaH
MIQCSDKKWFIAQIKPNSYDIAIQNLERQGYETFLPKMQITQRQKQKFINKNIYVFPGYLLVCFNPDLIPWAKINSTYGVTKILAFNNKPAEISSDLVLELKKRYEINSNLTQKERLQKGDSIKFYTGPFADLIARVESVDEKNRIWILFEAMGGYRRLKLRNIDKNKYNKF